MPGGPRGEDTTASGAVEVHVSFAGLIVETHGEQVLALTQVICALPKVTLKEFFILFCGKRKGRGKEKRQMRVLRGQKEKESTKKRSKGRAIKAPPLQAEQAEGASSQRHQQHHSP